MKRRQLQENKREGVQPGGGIWGGGESNNPAVWNSELRTLARARARAHARASLRNDASEKLSTFVLNNSYRS